MSRARLLLATACLAWGCSGEISAQNDGGTGGETVDGGDGAGSADGGGGIDAAVCVGVECGGLEWIEPYEREIVGKLTGEQPISAGVTLSARYTDGERDIARDYLLAELASHGLTPELHDYGTGANVWARLPATRGSDPELLVLGGHFDTVPEVPGAADNGTGTSVVLAAARYFAGTPVRDRDIIFVLFDEEELGLVGSQAFAEKMRLDSESLHSMHNFDMISWDEDGDGGVEIWSPPPELEDAYRTGAGDLGIPIAAYQFESSDHAAFTGAGFDAVGLSEEYIEGDSTPHYHQPSDSYDKIAFPFLAQTTRLAFLVVGRLAGVE